MFCPGNEHLTPPEIGRIKRPDGSWSTRWFENKFGAVKAEGQSFLKLDNRFFKFSANYGYHEIIVETPRHGHQLEDFSPEELRATLEVYKNRINSLSILPNISYVAVFKNHGAAAGTSIIHSHSQVIATNFLPEAVLEEVRAARRFIECPYCKVLEIEKRSLRRCFENSSFVAFCPYASRFNYECWIFPKKHLLSLAECTPAQIADLSVIMHQVLAKVQELGSPYNYYLHYSPSKEDLHFHIEIIPRMAIWAGFEFCSGTAINSISPEDAAAYYRGEQ